MDFKGISSQILLLSTRIKYAPPNCSVEECRLVEDKGINWKTRDLSYIHMEKDLCVCNLYATCAFGVYFCVLVMLQICNVFVLFLCVFVQICLWSRENHKNRVKNILRISRYPSCKLRDQPCVSARCPRTSGKGKICNMLQ